MKIFLLIIFIIILSMIIRKIIVFLVRGGNFYLIPRNITRTYKTIRDRFPETYKDGAELLFISGMINASTASYTKRYEEIVEDIYNISKTSNDFNIDEIQEYSLLTFISRLMYEYFLIDTNKSSDYIKVNIKNSMNIILNNIQKELNNKKYLSEYFIEMKISEMKKYYKYFEKKELSS